MIRCAKCGYVGNYYGPKCPSCKEKFNLTPEEIEEKIQEISKAEELKEYELAAEGHHILADMGRTESQKKYAALLEKGDIIARDLDAAMDYYYMYNFVCCKLIFCKRGNKNSYGNKAHTNKQKRHNIAYYKRSVRSACVLCHKGV